MVTKKRLTPIAVYKPVTAQLVEFETKYEAIVVDCSTTKGMTAAKDSRKELRDARLNLEDLRKETKSPVIAKGRQIDAEAKNIAERLQKLESKFDTAIKEVENAKEIAKQKELDAQLAKVKEFEAREAAILEKEYELGIKERPVDDTSSTDIVSGEPDSDSPCDTDTSRTDASTVADASVICEPHIKIASERLVALKKIRALVEPSDPQPTDEDGNALPIDKAIAKQHDKILAEVWDIVDVLA